MYHEEKKHVMFEGIVLKTKTLMQGKFIATIFTKEEGIITCHCFSKKHALLQSAFPWIYFAANKSSSDLFFIQDICQYKQLLLDNSLDALLEAASMAKVILTTQLPHKTSLSLYQLFLTYMKKLSYSENPHLLSLSFVLKTLLIEGIFRLETVCVTCENKASAIENGMSVCLSHASKSSFCFNAKEWEQMGNLAFVKQFSQLEKLQITEALERKIKQMFIHLYS
jgi:DNA repair protein RecO